jgi:hypothetical protein
MSRFRMCTNSCTITPRTWSGGRCWSSPWVTATTAFSGLRPVANAFGCSVGVGSAADLAPYVDRACGSLTDPLILSELQLLDDGAARVGQPGGESSRG